MFSSDQSLKIHNLIRLLCKDKIILDIGCGDLEYSQSALNSQASLVYAIDIKEPKKIIRDYRFTFHKADAQSLPLKDGTFDVIICIGLIEYVDLYKGIYEIKRLLKDSGLVIFQEKDSRGLKHKIYKVKCKILNKKIAGCPHPYNQLMNKLKENFEIVKYEETRPRHNFLAVLKKNG